MPKSATLPIGSLLFCAGFTHRDVLLRSKRATNGDTFLADFTNIECEDRKDAGRKKGAQGSIYPFISDRLECKEASTSLINPDRYE